MKRLDNLTALIGEADYLNKIAVSRRDDETISLSIVTNGNWWYSTAHARTPLIENPATVGALEFPCNEFYLLDEDESALKQIHQYDLIELEFSYPLYEVVELTPTKNAPCEEFSIELKRGFVGYSFDLVLSVPFFGIPNRHYTGLLILPSNNAVDKESFLAAIKTGLPEIVEAEVVKLTHVSLTEIIIN